MDEQATSPQPQATSPPAVQQDVTSNEPRSRLVAFLLNLSFGYAGIHQLYLGNKTQGWIRFGLAIAMYPLMIVFIGFLIAPVLFVWQVVDFFLLQFSTKTDADSQPLTVTNRDAAWQKGIFIVTLVICSLAFVVSFIAGMLGAFAHLQYRTTFDSNSINSDYPSGYTRSF